MWKMPIPEWSTIEVYQLCERNMRDADLQARLERAEPNVRTADQSYREIGLLGTLHTLDPSKFQLPDLPSQEMAKFYDRRMAAKSSPGRIVYDSLRTASKGGKCPLCGHREVMTLDHYLPKASFSALTVNPVNLVPACTDCNRAKLSAVLPTLHPYFDDIENDPWLHAEVLKEKPTAARYIVHGPETWSPVMVERVSQHFEIFGLSTLYSSQAARILSGIQMRLRKLHDEGGSEAVKSHLSEEARSWQDYEVNSWEAALYSALAASEWYCTRGFEL